MTNENSLTKFFTDTNTNLTQTERLASGVLGGGLIAYGLKRGDSTGTALAVIGGILGLRGATGHCQVKDLLNTENAGTKVQKWVSGKIEVKKAVTINKSPMELYAFWRNFENLPQFMKHLESVISIDNTRSHWTATAPLGYKVEWQAEITDEILNEKIGWRSLEGADIPNSGSVEFRATANRGTEVVVHIIYEAPAGKLGSLAAKIFGEEPSQQVSEDLRRFKSLMEASLIMKIEGQSSGRAAADKAKKTTA